MHKSQEYLHTALIDMSTLPKIGFIVMLGKQPIAAGFLRRLEPCFAQIDTLCSNAHFGSQIRHEGLKLVVNELILTAKSLKLKGIISLTVDKGILMRAKDIGFHLVEQSVIALPLSQE